MYTGRKFLADRFFEVFATSFFAMRLVMYGYVHRGNHNPCSVVCAFVRRQCFPNHFGLNRFKIKPSMSEPRPIPRPQSTPHHMALTSRSSPLISPCSLPPYIPSVYPFSLSPFQWYHCLQVRGVGVHLRSAAVHRAPRLRQRLRRRPDHTLWAPGKWKEGPGGGSV